MINDLDAEISQIMKIILAKHHNFNHLAISGHYAGCKKGTDFIV